MIVSNRLRLLAAFAVSGVIVASSGCSSVEGTTAPGLAPASASFAKGGNSGSSDSSTHSFSIDPTVDNTLDLGDHSLSIPAGAICNLVGSGYGATMWNAPCAPQTARLTISAKVKGSSNGLPRIDFEPALRFSPAHDVELTMYIKLAKQKNATAWRVLYCSTSSSSGCVDEAATDVSLRSQMISGNNWIQRRIKHFSGYLVAE